MLRSIKKWFEFPKLFLNAVKWIRFIYYRIIPHKINPLPNTYKIDYSYFNEGLPWGHFMENGMEFWRYYFKDKDGNILPTDNYFSSYAKINGKYFFVSQYNKVIGKWINSACNSKGLFEFGYGIYEFKAKSDMHKGINPAIWLFLHNDYYEIDMLENFDGKHQSTIHFTSNGERKQLPIRIKLDKGYHTYTCDYSLNHVSFYVDYKLFYKITYKKALRDPGEGIMIMNINAQEPEKLDKDKIYKFTVDYLKYKPHDI